MVKIKIDRIVRSKRKTLSLEIGRDATLLVRAPQKLSLKYIKKVVIKKHLWIKRNQQIAIEKCKRFIPKGFVNGEKFSFLGKEYCLSIISGSSVPFAFNNEFQLSKSYLTKAREIFINWYKKEAFKKFKERLEWFSYLSGVEYSKFNISNARKRWGSCSVEGNLYLNWRLIMAPLVVIDYVVIHELVHLNEKNHSKYFWNKVKELMPDYKIQREWLKRSGYLLSF